MGISGAVDWWEEWQLRILVLGSLLVHWFIFLSAPQRKHAIPSWFRSLIWLAYLGSDAIAIYALANLFSRQRRQDCSSGQGNSILEVVWAPVLLMHLGGFDSITAYNIEDNELWTRHVLTAVSQITVAIYVFWTSWPGGDKRLLQVAILFFTPGILKCLLKPWALKMASINSLVSFYYPRLKMDSKVGEINTLEEYLHKAKDFIRDYDYQGQGEGLAVDLEVNPLPQAKGDGDEMKLDSVTEEKLRLRSGPYRLFVDRPSSYTDRLSNLKKLYALDGESAYAFLKERLSVTFDLLYTKRSTGLGASDDVELVSAHIALVTMFLPFAAIGLFQKSHRGSYDVNDVKVTYVLICCTAVLEMLSFFFRMSKSGLMSSVMVAQYSLVSFFVRNKRHSKKMCILSCFNCKDLLDQRWCMKPCSSSSRITELVLGHVKRWWKEHIVDAASYRRFNDHRGQGTIQHKECNQDHKWGLDRPFDESVLLWHMATDMCFYQKPHKSAKVCREISNYMVYLLFVNPEMLFPGTNRNLFKNANNELEEILEDDEPLLKSILKGDRRSLLDGNKPFPEFVKRKGSLPEELEKGIMARIIAKLQSTECREKNPAKRNPTRLKDYINDFKEGFRESRGHPTYIISPKDTQKASIHDAWKIYEALLDLPNDSKMWEVIEGVWVEMLCFSASRCRGYLHAKSLANGGELLTYIWLMLSYMGMETLPERLLRTDLSSGGGNSGATPSTSQTSGSEKDPCPHEAVAARASASGPQEILAAE